MRQIIENYALKTGLLQNPSSKSILFPNYNIYPQQKISSNLINRSNDVFLLFKTRILLITACV